MLGLFEKRGIAALLFRAIQLLFPSPALRLGIELALSDTALDSVVGYGVYALI